VKSTAAAVLCAILILFVAGSAAFSQQSQAPPNFDVIINALRPSAPSSVTRPLSGKTYSGTVVVDAIEASPALAQRLWSGNVSFSGADPGEPAVFLDVLGGTSAGSRVLRLAKGNTTKIRGRVTTLSTDAPSRQAPRPIRWANFSAAVIEDFPR
jgi:hypothetical protein